MIPLLVSYKRILSTQFYEYVNRRLLNVQKLEKLAVPKLTVHELEQPVMHIAKKDFGLVSKDSTLADVVRKFKETKCEVIVIQDKQNRVVGTVSPSDLLHYLNGETGNNHA